MDELSTFRLYVLRAMYALIGVGLMLHIWPLIVFPGPTVTHMGSVVRAMLGALSALCFLGIRYPVKMIPLLLWELLWKTIWVVAFGLPLWWNNRLDADTSETLVSTLAGVVLVPIALPWGYLYRQFVRTPGDRWRGAGE